MADPRTITEALEAYSALGMSPAGFAKALFRDIGIARSAVGDSAVPGEAGLGKNPPEALPAPVAASRERAGAVPALPVGAVFDREADDAEMTRLRSVAAGGAREVRRAIAEAVSAERERAGAAEATLAALRSVLLEGGQDAGTARRRALAVIGDGGKGGASCLRST
jgi:hypothetical protein